MGARGAADDSSVLDKIQVTQGNWANFVLLRHTLEIGKTTKEQQEFYSLYMHLAPPSWWRMSAMNSPGEEVDVPWLWKWVSAENGVLIKIRESKDDRFPIGVPLPLQARISPDSLDGVRIVFEEEAVKFMAFDASKNFALISVAVPQSTSLDDAVWIYLPPPPHIKLVCEALRSGTTVFLDGQFLSVKQGESIGLVGAFQPDGTVIKAQDASVAARKGLSSNFIHWECFAKNEQAFKKLADPLSEHGFKFESLKAPAFVEPATETDPFFKYKDYVDSLRPLLKTQPKAKAEKATEDKAAEPSSNESADGFPEVGPEGPGAKFVQQIESFFETTSVGLMDRVLLHLNVKDMPKPSQYRVKGAAGSISKYRLNVCFLQGSIASTEQKPLIVGEESFVELEDKDWSSNPVIEKLAVFVPKPGYSIGDVDLLKITDTMGGAFQLVLRRSKVDWKGFQARTEVLWRNLLLTHDSDWVPDVAKHFIKDNPKASDSSNTPPADEVVVKPTDVGWWNDQAVVLKAGEKLPDKLESIAKSAPSFLGDGKGIVSVHPVTLKWLLEYVTRSEEQQAQFLCKGIHQSLPTADRKSYFRTLVPLGYKDLRSSPCGGSLTVIALDNLYYASGKDGAAAIRLKPKLPGVAPDVIVEVPFGGYGVALKEISLDVWGDWELSLADRSEESKEWIDADGVKTFDFSIAPPELDLEKLAQDAYQPKATGHDEFSWKIPWKTGVHCATYGGMVELVLISGSQKIPTGIGVIPKTTDHHQPKSKLVELGKDDPKLWKLEDGCWIVPDQQSDKDAKITANFSFSEWKKAAKGPTFRLHQKLACAVQDLREQGKSLIPKVLSESGLEASLKVYDSKHGEKLKRAGLESGLFETIELTKASKTETWIRLVISEKEVNETGLVFDLSHALELLADSAVVKAMDGANAAAGFAGDVSAASGMVAKAASLDSQGSKVSKGAGKVSDATGKAAAHKTGEFTVAFHLLPKHFIRMSERSDGLLTAFEWARYLKDYPTYVAIPPGATIATPDASSAMSSAKGFVSEKAGELTGKVSSFLGVSDAPNPAGDALASAKPASPICIVAANPIGSLGSQSFSEPKISQVFPDKPEGDLKLKVTAKLTGGPKLWKEIDVRLRGDVGGGTIEITGSKGADEAVFLIPWPSGSGSSFNATLCGVPVTMQGNPASSMIPRALNYEIHLQPNWERLQPVMTFIKNDLVFNLTVLGLKGCSSKSSTTGKSGKPIKLSPTQQAEKVSIEAFHEGEKIVLPIKGIHPFSGEGFTYADAGFKLDLRVANLKKAKPGKISITLSAAGKRHRFLFDWDGRTIPSGDGIMIFDPDQPDPVESVPANQSTPQSGQESEPVPAPDACDPDEPEAPNPFRFYELNPDFMTIGVRLD